MKPLACFAALCSLLLVSIACGQSLSKRLTNRDVIEMAAMGLSDDVIVEKIRTAAASDTLALNTSMDGLKELKAGKVSDDVIKVMINPTRPAVAVVSAASAPMAADPNLPPPEVGVYWKDGSNFVAIEGQALSHSKAGGRANSFFTYGIASLHWDATLDGKSSRNMVKDHRPVFYLYVPDGASASDFQLIRLNQKGDRREFQIGSFGGFTGGKSGIKKDKELSFNSQHVAIRTFKVTPDADLPGGEYAFFMGTGQQLGGGNSGRGGAAGSGGSTSGRIYDFKVPQ